MIRLFLYFNIIGAVLNFLIILFLKFYLKLDDVTFFGICGILHIIFAAFVKIKIINEINSTEG